MEALRWLSAILFVGIAAYEIYRESRGITVSRSSVLFDLVVGFVGLAAGIGIGSRLGITIAPHVSMVVPAFLMGICGGVLVVVSVVRLLRK